MSETRTYEKPMPEKMGFHHAESEICNYNVPSLRLACKPGFTEEGRLREARLHGGKYYDILPFGFLREDYEKRKG